MAKIMRKKMSQADRIFLSKDRWEVIITDLRDGTREYYDIPIDYIDTDKTDVQFAALNSNVAEMNKREGYERWIINKSKVDAVPYSGQAYYFGGLSIAKNLICYDCAIKFIQEHVLPYATEFYEGGFELEDGTVIRRRNPLEVSKNYAVPLEEEVCRLYKETDWPILEFGLPCEDCGRYMATPMRAAVIIARNCMKRG